TAMRYKYVVILKKTNERTTDILSVLLCLFSALAFAYHGLRSLHRWSVQDTGRTTTAPTLSWLCMVVSITLLVGLVINFILNRYKGRQVRYRHLLLLSAIGWIGLTPVPWLGLVFMALTFLEYQTKRPLEIGFDLDRIVMNTLIPRRFTWTDFNNIILKDGLLTLDFKNNRLLQREVADDEDEDDADEEEFNMFCRQRLAVSSGLTV
ncbi:MAG: hypothetical protein JST42_02275, partial [Bacteroidetes bacterium]|nr:hypothetical protein [Bacteroidota bacterium]